MKAVEITHGGRTLSMRGWAKMTGIRLATIHARLKAGWDVARALTPPARRGRGGRHSADEPRPVPRMKRHAGSGQAFARWKAGGRDCTKYFGGWGTAAAREAYRQFASAWVAAVDPGGPVPGGVSVAALLAAWVGWATGEYTKFGVPTGEVRKCKRVAALLNAASGGRLAASYTPADLSNLQRSWVARGTLSRETINEYQAGVVRAFRWAVGSGLIPPAVAAALREVPKLRPGRTTAAEPRGVSAVPWADVLATLPHLSADPGRRAILEAVVRFQRLAGCRPGEACAVRPCDLDTTGEIWAYTVAAEVNKNHHRGKVQWYAIGPQARAVLSPHLVDCGPSDRVFRFPAKRTGEPKPVRGWGYRAAIREACVRAGVTPWHAHQLRHAYATEAARATGSMEAAAAGIGDTVGAARGYVHCDPQAAQKIALAQRLG